MRHTDVHVPINDPKHILRIKYNNYFKILFAHIKCHKDDKNHVTRARTKSNITKPPIIQHSL